MLWPELKHGAGVQPPMSERHETGNLQGFLAAAKPGSWNMPDQLVIGQTPCPGFNYTVPGNPRGMHCDQLTTVEEETVFAFWCAQPTITHAVPSGLTGERAVLLFTGRSGPLRSSCRTIRARRRQPPRRFYSTAVRSAPRRLT